MFQKWIFNRFVACPVFLLLVASASHAVAEQENGGGFVSLEFEELSDLEQRADLYREAYWSGNLDKACAGFESLSIQHNSSRGLYLREWALAELGRGNTSEAKHLLLEAVNYSESLRDADLEKEAMSKGGKEVIKIYVGDPYERALTYALLALIFLNEDDPDNALAACKSGILADSDAVENLYESDLTLLYLLEAKCYDLRGERVQAARAREQAASSYRVTHHTVRDLFGARLDYVARLKMSRKERKKLDGLVEEAAIHAEIDRLTERIETLSETIPVAEELGALYTGEFNFMLLQPVGMGPRKRQHGSMLEAVIFEPQLSSGDRPVILHNGKADHITWLDDISDINFQANTRGGRRMDMILRGQASFKANTIGVGAGFIEAGNQIGGLGGLGIALVGSIVQAAGASVTPDADTRSWATLPEEILVSAMTLQPGEHGFWVSQRLYYEKQQSHTRTVQIEDKENTVRFLWIPPEVSGSYSTALFDISENRKRRPPRVKDTGEQILLVPPILGLGRVERISCVAGEMDSPVVAPDPERLTKKMVSAIKEGGFDAVYLSHREALQLSLTDKYPTAKALQIYYETAELTPTGKNHYQVRMGLEFRIIDPGSGQAESRLPVEVMWHGSSKEGPSITEVFQKLVVESVEQFLAGLPSGLMAAH